jgi:hypothetical protein
MSARSTLSSIFLGGFIAGTIDIGAACLINSAKPSVILQAIASGLLGKSAFGGGARTLPAPRGPRPPGRNSQSHKATSSLSRPSQSRR